MIKKVLLLGYSLVFVCLFLYSFTQIDLGLVISRYPFFYNLERIFQHVGYFERPLSSYIYSTLIIALTVLYSFSLMLAAKRQINKKFVWRLVIAAIILLTFSYNAFSYDIFNYMFDAKIVTHYFANPYVHKALDYPNDPMLAFMHWTHRTYPYGPVWLFLTVPLSFLGFQLFLPTFFLFKFLMAASYLGTAYFIGKIMRQYKKEQEVFSMVFFALNPLVLIESLVSGHIDIVMMFFCMMAFSYLLSKRYLYSYGALMISIGIKFVTGILLPVFLWVQFASKKRMPWDTIIIVSFLLLLLGVFVESKNSGNFQPWYLLVPMAFAALLANRYYIALPAIVISVFSLVLYLPFLYLGNWDPPVPELLGQIMVMSYTVAFAITSVYFLYRQIRTNQKSKNRLL